MALSIQYIYHPVPPLGPSPQANITTPEKEEILLSPMRIPKMKKSPVVNWQKVYFCSLKFRILEKEILFNFFFFISPRLIWINLIQLF